MFMKTLEYSQFTNGTSKYYLTLKKKRVSSLNETLFLVFRSDYSSASASASTSLN